MGWQQQLRGAPLPCSPSLPLTLLRPVLFALLSSASSLPHNAPAPLPPPSQRSPTTPLSHGCCRHRSKYASFSSLNSCCFKSEVAAAAVSSSSSSLETRRGFRVLAHAQEKGSRRPSTVWDDAADAFFDKEGKKLAPVAAAAAALQEDESIRSLGERRNKGFQPKSNNRNGGDVLGGTNRGESQSQPGRERNARASSSSSSSSYARGGEWDDIEVRAGSKGEGMSTPYLGTSTRDELHRGRHMGSGSKNDREYAAGREWKLASTMSSKGGGVNGIKGREWERAGPNRFPRAEQMTRTRNWGTAESWKTSMGETGSNRGSQGNRRRSVDGYRSDRRGGYGRGGGAKIESLAEEENDDGDDQGEDEEEEEEEWEVPSGREWAAARKHEAIINWRLEGEPVYGVAPIRAALVASRREFYTLYVQENLTENIATGKRKDKQALVWVLNRTKEIGVRLKVVSKHDLNLLVDNRPHQGLVLDASPLELVPIEKLDKVSDDGAEAEAPVWVALDEVVDPQNFGAILRSAYFLGATGVVVCVKNSAPLSGVVSKASAGALEVMEVQSCRNMVKFLDMSVQNGWRAVGASFEPQALAVRDLAPGLPTILVLGNEGRGLRTNVRRVCSDLVCIAGLASKRPLQDFSQGQQSPSKEPKMVDVDGTAAEEPAKPLSHAAGPAAVDSLNVSVAAGILLHELLARSVYPTSLSSVETISHDTAIKEASSTCG